MSLDLLFNAVDYVERFDLVGGEPFLYTHFEEILDYLYERYNSRYGILDIFTNGTVIPSASVIQKLRDYSILVSDSNYKAAKRHKEFDEILQQNDVNLRVLHRPWLAVRQLIQSGNHFDSGEKCLMKAVSIIDDRLYNCAFLAHGDVIGAFPFNEENYLQLTNATTYVDVEKYMSVPHPACSFCSGSVYTKRPIRKAAQAKQLLEYKKYPRESALNS
jgi:hypothetical protein